MNPKPSIWEIVMYVVSLPVVFLAMLMLIVRNWMGKDGLW